MKLPDDLRVELIDGDFYMCPSPFLIHQRIVGNLHLALRRWVDERTLGTVHIAPLDVHLPTGDIVQPDLIFVSTARSAILQDWIRGVPDLLIEVLSSSTPERDRIVKRDLYGRNGVPEYWIVDSASCCVEIFRWAEGTLAPAGYFQEADSVVSPALPGLVLPVRNILS